MAQAADERIELLESELKIKAHECDQLVEINERMQSRLVAEIDKWQAMRAKGDQS